MVPVAIELAVAYLPVVAETSKIPGQVRSSLQAASRGAEAEGRNLGQKLSGGLGTALKAGAATAGATASVAIGTALTKGFQRLTAIDDAKGKLAGLGTSTQGTAKIMNSALASVKGTAFGLGDAATIAANAVAAGIKPGQDLTKYLSMTADAASIAGVSLSDMGQILNQVSTGGVAMTDDLNQLADRGIPIYQWLGKEAGVAAGDVKGLASEGKISSEMLFKAIQQNIGGAAQQSGRTVKGAFQNVVAAMGRIGAAAEAPTFARLPGWFGTLTSKIDAATPSVKRMAQSLDDKIFLNWGPRAGKAIDEARDALTKFSQTPIAQESFASLKGVFQTLVDSGREAGPAIAKIAASLAQASGALGVSSWQIFLSVLQASATVLSVIAPILSGLAGVMQGNQAAVTALAAGFLLFKTIPGLLARVSTGVAPIASGVNSLSAATRTAATQMRTLSTASGAVVNAGRYGAVQMGRFGSAIATVGQSAPAVARMQSSFVGAAAGADRFGRTAGLAAAAGTGLRTAGSGLAGVFGGPVGLALTGAVVAGTAWASSVQKQKSYTDAYRASLSELAEEQKNTNALLIESRGTANTQVYGSLTKQIDSYRNAVNSAAKADAKWTDVAGDVLEDTFSIFTGGSDDTTQKLDAAAQSAQAARAAIGDLGLTSEQIGMKVSASNAQWVTFKSTLLGMGAGGEEAANQLQKLRDTFTAQQESARRLSPGVNELQAAMQKLGDSTATTADKSNALKQALDALNPARGKQAAMAELNAVNQQIAKSAQEAADATQGFGRALIANDGSVSTNTANGQELYQALSGVVDAYGNVASAGGDMSAANRANQQSFQQLATKYGVSIDEIRNAANTLGYSDVQLVVDLKGGSDAVQQLGALRDAFSNIPSGRPKVVEVQTGQLTADTKASLTAMGFTLQEIDKNGVKTVQIGANDLATGALNAVINKLIETGNTTANPAVVLNDSQFRLTDANARNQLANLKSQVADPRANLIIDQLLQNKNISFAQLRQLDKTISNPQVRLEVEKILANISLINKGLDDTARARTAYINAQVSGLNFGDRTPDGGVFRGPGISRNAAGGLIAGAGTATSDSIPAMLSNGEFVVKASETAKHRGLLERINSGQVARYATGGLVKSEDFDDLARGGLGASRSLEGADYNWGGVNWGDCSGTQSAFARLAAGLDPFGGRFATASEGQSLQQMGATSGLGGPGDLRFGWLNGGPGGGHTAGTLPSGINVEMGGARGNGQYGGGAAGADDPQFTDHAFFPKSMFAAAVAIPTQGAGTDPGGSLARPDLSTTATPDDVGATGVTSSISQSLGNVASSFVSGQISSLLGVLGINDNPPIMDAISKAKVRRVEDPGTTKPKPGEDLGRVFDQGGEASGIGMMFKKVLRPERVLSPNETAAFQDGMRGGFAGGTEKLEAKVDELINVMSKRPPLVPVVVPDEAGRRRVERDRVVQRHLVGK